MNWTKNMDVEHDYGDIHMHFWIYFKILLQAKVSSAVIQDEKQH